MALALACVLAAAPALQVEVDPAAPMTELVRGALAMRLPGVALRLERKPLAGDELAVTLGLGEGRWSLRIRRPDGSYALARELPADGSPESVAESSAVIVERFLRQIEWRALSEPLSAIDLAVRRTAPAPSPPPELPPDPPAAEAPPPPPAAEAPPAPPSWQWTPALGVFGGLGLNPFRWSQGPELAVEAERSSRWLAGLRLRWQLAEEATLAVRDPLYGERGVGVLRARRAEAWLLGARCWGERLRGCTGLAAGPSVSWGEAGGDGLFEERVGAGLSLAAGAVGLVGLALPAGMRAQLTLALVARLPQVGYGVQGLGVVYRESLGDFSLGLGIGRAR